MTSRLLTRLDTDIRGASTPALADALRCERAAYLARHGDPDAATRELRAVRERHTAMPRLSIYAWLNLAEGLIDHHGPDTEVARAKVARAHALGGAVTRGELRALAAAWLAAFDARDGDLAGMARHVAEALALSGPDAHGTQARAALVVAQGYDAGDRPDLARPWYARAHWHATTEGDDAALSAQLWTMATLRTAAWRRAAADPRPHAGARAPRDPCRHACSAVASARRFDRWSGIRRAAAPAAILRAQVCLLAGDTDAARPLYETHLQEGLGQGMGSPEGTLLADRAWCRLQAGDIAGAQADARAAEASLERPQGTTDRAPAHARLAQAYDIWGDSRAAARQRDLAARARTDHLAAQQRLLQVLDALTASVPDWARELGAEERVAAPERRRA